MMKEGRKEGRKEAKACQDKQTSLRRLHLGQTTILQGEREDATSDSTRPSKLEDAFIRMAQA